MTRRLIARAGVIAAGLLIAVAAFGKPLQASGYVVATCLTGEVECQAGGSSDCPGAT